MGLLSLSQLIFHDKALQPSLLSLSSPLIPLGRPSVCLSVHLSTLACGLKSFQMFLQIKVNHVPGF